MHRTVPPPLSVLLSSSELSFFSSYEDLIAEYGDAIDLDLCAFSGGEGGITGGGGVGGEGAPRGNMIEVRVVGGAGATVGNSALGYGDGEGGGEIAMEGGGYVHLDFGSTHFLRRGDVEALIREGILEQINGDEGC